MRWVGSLAEVRLMFLVCNVCMARSEHDEYGVDVAKLASLTKETELLVLENALHNQKTYRLEDFFWTGSGDGSPEEEEKTSWKTMEATTVYSTKTVLSTSTVYMTPPTITNQTEFPCSINCDPIANQTEEFLPTFADRQFWLLTVLKSDGKDPDVAELKKSLAVLYKKAFLRQQAKHLGIQAKTKREAKPDKPISVFLHKVEKLPEKIEVVYHVSVSGQPVDAVTASEDMQLITDEEVKQELGFPFLIKAEPYIKPSTPQELALDKPNWVYIGVSTIIVLLLLLVVIIFATWVTKQKRPLREENIQQVFQGEENLGFEQEPKKYKSGRRNQQPSPTYINFRSQPSNATLLSGVSLVRPGSSTSSSCGSSVDISPLMGLGKQRGDGKKVLRPKAAINKTVPMRTNKSSLSLETESSSMTKSQDTVFIGNYDPGVVSPKSYLSMPSIKSFPRSNNPEPLNKVLEPVSVLHLDMNDDVGSEPKDVDYSMFTRHGSVGTSEDPGVIGPVVWNMHCHRLQHGVSVDGGMDEMKMPANVSKMRKRFHDLLDDTFSLFGSRKESMEKDDWRSETKSHRDVDRSFEVPTLRVRPKTTDPKRGSNFGSPPKGAWTSSAPSPLVRPVSAPFVRPNTAPSVDVDHVLATGKLRPNDPAIPLIAAIKKELGRCALPGSTTNLNE